MCTCKEWTAKSKWAAEKDADSMHYVYKKIPVIVLKEIQQNNEEIYRILGEIEECEEHRWLFLFPKNSQVVYHLP